MVRGSKRRVDQITLLDICADAIVGVQVFLTFDLIFLPIHMAEDFICNKSLQSTLQNEWDNDFLFKIAIFDIIMASLILDTKAPPRFGVGYLKNLWCRSEQGVRIVLVIQDVFPAHAVMDF